MSLKSGDPIISKLQTEYPEQPLFLEAQARRLAQLADLDELLPSEKLVAFDKAAELAAGAAQKHITEKRGQTLELRAELLMYAANVATGAESTDGALRRLSAALSATDEASELDPRDRSENALNGAAILAMQAAIEASRGNSQAAEDARIQARRRLQSLDASDLREQSDRERLQQMQAVLAVPADSILAPPASNR